MSLPCPRIAIGMPVNTSGKSNWLDNIIAVPFLLVTLPIVLVMKAMGRVK